MKFSAVFSITLLFCGMAAGQGNNSCNRECLNGFVDQYLDALVKHDPKLVPLTKNVKFTENGQRLDPGDGLWRSMSSKGTYRLFVTDTEAGEVAFLGTIREQGRKAAARTLEVQVLRCPEQIAARLQIECDALVVSRRQERCIDGVVWSLQTSFYPQKWVALGAGSLLEPADIGDGTVNYLAEAIGLKQVSYRDLLSTRLPSDREQTLFNLSHHHTVLEICRTSFAEDGTPIRVTVTVYPADRNQIAYDIGPVPGSAVPGSAGKAVQP